MDLRADQAKGATKRFQPTLETIPSKRLKFNAAMPVKPLPIRSQAQKNAILNTMASASSSALVNTVPMRKLPLTKSTSGSATSATTSKFSAVPSKPAAAASKAKPTAPAKPGATRNNGLARPAPYDYKARYALLSDRHSNLKAKYDELNEQKLSWEEQNEAAEQKEREYADKLEAVEQQLFEANEEKEMLKEEIAQLKSTTGHLTTKNKALAQELVATSEELSELKVKQVKLEEIARDHEVLKEKTEGLEAACNDASQKLLQSQDKLYLVNIERMQLHNQVLDLRGNIRVFARVRPPLKNEGDKMLCSFNFSDETALEIMSNEMVPTGGRKQLKHDFAFDHVFDPNTHQEDIFEIVAPMIQSALDGYNVCIFAYGE